MFLKETNETFLNRHLIRVFKMASRIGGSKRKSRYKTKKHVRRRGKISITKFFQKFELGDKVYLDIEPAVQKGMYAAKYIGKPGIIKKQTGKCYNIAINDGKKEKIIIVHPVHLRKR